MPHINKEDIILCESYRWLCDYIYGAGFTSQKIVPPEGIVCVALDEIVDFFKLIDGKTEKYVIVSPRSDFGLFYQKDYPPSLDLLKITNMLVNDPGIKYHGLNIAPRCDLEKCNINDKYSIKMHSWTKATFNKIPDNVIHWFVVNNGIYDNRKVESIPFGIGGSKPEDVDHFFELSTKYRNNNRIEKLYINFGDSTFERVQLREWYKQQNFDWVVIKENIPFDEYIEDLCTYKYVLCPNGNGVDCYRTMESIYCGAIPIVEYGCIMGQFNDFPLLYAHNLKFHNYESFRIMAENLSTIEHCEKTKLSYWRNCFNKEKSKL